MPQQNLAYIAFATGQPLSPAQALSYPGLDEQSVRQGFRSFGGGRRQSPDAEGGLPPDMQHIWKFMKRRELAPAVIQLAGAQGPSPGEHDGAAEP